MKTFLSCFEINFHLFSLPLKFKVRSRFSLSTNIVFCKRKSRINTFQIWLASYFHSTVWWESYHENSKRN